MKNILWLPSWYPTIQSPQNGDFIRRHALTVSSLVNLNLLYVTLGDLSCGEFPVHNIPDREELNESVVIASGVSSFLFPRILSNLRLYYLYFSRIGWIVKTEGTPDITHVHVSFRAGVFAMWLKFRHGVPYVLSEHWTLFTDERSDNYLNRNFFFRLLIKRIISEAAVVMVVSDALGNGIQRMVVDKPFVKIPNVVDTRRFFYKQQPITKEFKFIHVSGMSDNKNPVGIINSFRRLASLYPNVLLTMVGTPSPSVIESMKDNCQGRILLTGNVEYGVVAEELQSSSVFVLFSDTETQSCVTIEALCCGVPVIAPRLPCITEMINVQNGLLVPPRDEDALFAAMEKMILNYQNYKRSEISQAAQSLYNPTVVGQQIMDVYEKVISENKRR